MMVESKRLEAKNSFFAGFGSLLFFFKCLLENCYVKRKR